MSLSRVLSVVLVAAGMVVITSPARAALSPTTITMTQAKPTSNSVYLSWTSGNKPGNWSYEIQIQDLSHPKNKVITKTSKVPSLKFAGLLPNTVYLAKVHMVLGKFYYPWSQTLRFVTTASKIDDTSIAPVVDPKPVDPGVVAPIDTTTIINITSLYITETASTTVRVNWVSANNPKTFILTLLDASGTTPVKEFEIEGSLRTFVVSSLIPQTTYNLRIAPTGVADGWKAPALMSFTTPRVSVTGLITAPISTTSVGLSWIPVPNVYLYDIYRDGVQIASSIAASASTYSATNLTPGFTYSFAVRAQTKDGNGNLVYSDITQGVPGAPYTDINYAPSVLSVPVITLPYANVPIVGATLSASTGVWSNTQNISYSYQWQRSLDNATTWQDISGQTSSTYVVAASDYSYKVRVVVTARNVNGANSASSSASGVIDCIYNVQIPVIRGNLVVGQLLEVNEGIWSSKYPYTFTYQWQKNDVNITGETSNLYTLLSTDVGARITVKVTAITTLGSLYTISAVRSAVSMIANTVLPVVSGDAKTFSTLSTTAGTWIGNPVGTTYQWQRSADNVTWDAIPGATTSSYTIALADNGYYIRSQVIETKTVSAVDYRVIAASLPTAQVQLLVLNIYNTVAPVVSGSWTVGQSVSVSTGTWNVSGTYAYQWQTSANGSSWSDIVGATASSYSVVAGDTNNYLRARVTLTNGAATGIEYSNATAKVGSPYNSVLPVISGTQQVGETLTVSTGTWTGTPVYNYTWQYSTDGIAWTTIVSSSANTWVATYALANNKIRVVVSAGNGIDTPTVTAAFVTGFAPPRATVVPVVTGTVSVGQVLTSSTGTWPNTSTGYAYQWQRSSDAGLTWVNIPSAISSTYTLVAGDLGYVIRSQVAVTTNSGTSAAYSLPTVVVS